MAILKLLVVFLAIVDVLKGDELVKGTVIIFRHGDRNPQSTYKNDIYKGLEHWPEGYEQLTVLGMKQAYKLGQRLRKKYEHLLDEVYNGKQIYVRSTDIDRTIMSAQACLAGLFPIKKSLRFKSNIPWRPATVHTVPSNQEYLLLMMKSCPRYEKLLEDLLNEEEFTEFVDDNEWVRRHVKKNSGEDIKNFFKDLYLMYDTLKVEELHKKTLPRWTKTIYPEKLSEIAHKHFLTKTHNREMARLIIGSLAKEITENLIKMYENNITQRVIMYSAHDVTISNLLNAMNLKKNQMPPYAASLQFELLQGPSEAWIRVVYEGETLQVPNCGTVCPISKWKDSYQTLFLENRDEECKV